MYIFYCVNCGLGGIYIPLNKNLYWLDFCWTNYLLFFLLAPPVKPLNQWVLQKYDEEWVLDVPFSVKFLAWFITKKFATLHVVTMKLSS